MFDSGSQVTERFRDAILRPLVWERFDLGQACSQDCSHVLSLLDCGRRCRCAVESLPGQEPQDA